MHDVCLPSEDMLVRADELAPELALPQRTLVFSGGPVTAERLAGVEFWVPDFELANVESMPPLLARMPRLKVVQAQSAGIEALVEVELGEGIQLCDARGAHGSSTSEWALTAILSVLREFGRFAEAQAAGRWDRAVTEELAGKQVLIVGAGDIGDNLARRVAACDAHPVMVARTARPGVYGPDALPDLLPGAEVVVITVPATPQTYRMVDAGFLARMRDGALLVNISRGSIVDTDALVAELQSGRLRAALDVTDPEPLPPGHALWTAPNLLLTPHIGGAVTGVAERITRLVVAQLRLFSAGEPLRNVVTGDY